MADRVDVMLPFYGELAQLRVAVESVLAQTHTEFRLVCVDDAYPSDEPKEWILGLDDPRVEYVRNDGNLGVARNFTRCLELVQTDRFVMMGGDDFMMPDYLRTVVGIAQRNPDAAVIQPGVAVMDEQGRPSAPLADRVKALVRPRVRGAERTLAGEDLGARLARADWAYFPSLLWSTQAVRAHGFDERYAVALDLALLFDIVLAGGSLVLSDDVCFRYRRHRSSVSSATAHDGLRFAQERSLLDEYADRFARRGWPRAARVARRRIIPRLSAGATSAAALLAGRPADAWRLLRYVVG